MDRFAAIVFPVTVPDEQTLNPLVQVFQPLVYCQPVEDGKGKEKTPSFVRDEFLDDRFCAEIFPAPLGEDRERFLRLLHDLRNRGDDYAAQLTHLSLASMGISKKEQETKGAILTTLLGRHGIQQNGRDKLEMLLWQARLILKLGEFFDEDQRYIRHEMEKISAREQGLLSDLRRESEYSPFFSGKSYSVPTPEDNLQRLRMKAWTRMFALGKESPCGYKVYVTGSMDAVDRLAEEYEGDKKKSPELVLDLILPASLPTTPHLLETMQQFGREASKLIGRINKQINGAESDAELPGEWKEVVDNFFPAENHGRRELQLYSFKQVSPQKLFLKSFGHGEERSMLQHTDGELMDIIIGMLS